MIRTQKIKIQTTEEQERILDSQSKICNWLYNQFLEGRINAYKWFKKSVNYYECNAYLPEFKKENPFLKTVYSQVLKETLRQLEKSYNNFFRRVKEGKEKAGFPKFKSWKKKWFSLTYPKNKGYNFSDLFLSLSLGRDIENHNLKLSLKLNEQLLYSSIFVIGIIISKENKNYYVSIIYNVEDVPKKEINKVIAIDPNHQNLFQSIDNSGNSILMSGYKIAKNFNKKIDKLKSMRDHCLKGEKRWIYLNKAIERLYFRAREQTKLQCYTIANYLCKNYDLVLYGDYVPFITEEKYFHKGMLTESIVGQLRKTIAWVCEKTGKTFELIDEYRTTKTCSRCGEVIEQGLEPKVREFNCPQCGLKIQRDLNSSINIYKKSKIVSYTPVNINCIEEFFYSSFSGLKKINQTNPNIIFYNKI